MKRTFTKLMAALALLVFMTPSMVGWGQTRTETTTTYTFTAADWSASTNGYSANWTCGKAGAGFNNSGIQVTTNSNGANGTSPVSFTNVTKIVATYNTNKSAGSGTIEAKIGTNEATTKNWAYSGSGDGRTAFYTVQWDYNTPQTGSVKITCNTTTNSIYLVSVAITTTSGGSTTYTVTYDCNGGTSGCPENVTGIEPDDEITLADEPSKTGHAFNGWNDGNTTYDAGDPYTVTENVTMTAQWTAYTVTAQSNNTDWGTVSVSDFTITASPATNYRVSTTTPYTVTNGTATVTNNGNNTFTVTPTSNCAVQINFEAIPTYTVNFYAGSGTCSTPSMTDIENATITLPTATPSPACASRGWTFAGWATASVSETTDAQTLLNGTYSVTADVDLYAVYTKEEEGGNAPSAFSVGNTGSYAIVAEIDNEYYALPTNPTINNGKITAQKITVSEESGVKYIKTADATNFTWTIAAATYGYSLYDGSKYIYHSTGGNSGTDLAIGTASTYTWSFTIDGNYVKMAAMNGSTVKGRGMLFSGTTIGGYSLSNWNSYDKTMILPVGDASTVYYATSPDCQEQVATPYFTPAAGTYTGAQTVTINCNTAEADIFYKTTEDGEWQAYSAAIPVSTSTTIWAKATHEGMDDSEVAEATYTIQYTLTVDIDDMVEYFLFDNSNETWDEITLDENGQALVPSGADIRISGGEVYDDCYEVESFDVTDGNDNPVTVVDNTDEDGSYSFTMPASNATLTATINEIADHYTLTVVGVEQVSFEMLVGSMSTITPLNANHQALICEASEVKISELTATTGHVLESVTLTYGGQTTVITPTSGVYEFAMPSSDATLTITTYEVALFTYTKVTSVTPGKHYIIVTASASQGKYHAMGGNNSTGSNPYMNPVEVNVVNNTVTVAENEGVAEILIDGTEDHYTLHTSEGYLAGGDKKLDINGTVESTWGISFDNDQAVITWSNTNYAIQYNPSNPRFACYSSSQTKVCLYEKNEYDLTINGYTDVTEGTNNRGYYLIASPVTVDPATVEGMTEGDFDLYYFDQEQEDEWRNYEAGSFNLVPGTGYLYAKKAANGNSTYSFELTGIPYAGDGTVHLVYNENAEFRGFNLIGNPFGTNANLDLPYYRLNSDGSALNTSTESTQVFVMEGVFVQATTSIRTATFSSAAKRVSQLNVKVTRNRSAVLDNAIIRFDNGAVLGKFQLNPNNTKLYITEGNQDYAVVRSNNAGEMPVNFKAAENGNYTLSIEAENVEASYLHLIDNMTGADVDLLATPSYSFEARTTDYANRFRLEFNTNGVEENNATANFAYFNGSSWTIDNMGEATLQVVDMMGRVISTETIGYGLWLFLPSGKSLD